MRVEAVLLGRVESDPLSLHSGLDCMPLEARPGEVVGDLPAILAFVLEVSTATGLKYSVFAPDIVLYDHGTEDVSRLK